MCLVLLILKFGSSSTMDSQPGDLHMPDLIFLRVFAVLHGCNGDWESRRLSDMKCIVMI